MPVEVENHTLPHSKATTDDKEVIKLSQMDLQELKETAHVKS